MTTEPVTTEPVTTEPVTTEPVTTEPVPTEPVTTELNHRMGRAGCRRCSCRRVARGWVPSTPSSDGTFDRDIGLAEYEAVARNVPDILHFFKTGAGTFPTADEIAMSERDGEQASLLLYNWKPSPTLTWREIADGGADESIRSVAAGLQRYPKRLFLTVHHEPENEQGSAGSGRTPVDYVDMYRHVVGMLRAEGVTNAVYVMNFMGFAGWAPVADDFYPGDDVVDWIAYDPYGHAGQSTFAELLNRPTGDDWPGFYTWATQRAPGKPIMVAEWGYDLAGQPGAPAALDGAVESLTTDFPMVKALVYWNSWTDEYNYRLDQPTALGAEYGAAYARMANDPYFNSTSVGAGAPRLVVITPSVASIELLRDCARNATFAVRCTQAVTVGNESLDPPPRDPGVPVAGGGGGRRRRGGRADGAAPASPLDGPSSWVTLTRGSRRCRPSASRWSPRSCPSPGCSRGCIRVTPGSWARCDSRARRCPRRRIVGGTARPANRSTPDRRSPGTP